MATTETHSVQDKLDGSMIARDRESYAELAQKNIENFVGLARVPIGLAGPLRIVGQHVNGMVHVPLATTEGTLVASTCRGMKVINASGGVTTRVIRHGGIQRAPVFEFADVQAAQEFAAAISADWQWLAPIVASTTTHGQLLDVRSFVSGRCVHLRLSMNTGDAAGQNMVSVAAAKVVEALIARFAGVQRCFMEGGYSGEKVPSNLNMLLGRGRAVVASAVIPGSVLEGITRAVPTDLVRLFAIYANASLHTGTKNSHASLINILPAIYIATGQDVASVPESSMAHNEIIYDAAADLLHFSVSCPNIVAATVGGGTSLPTQRECLALMDCAGPGRADAFAEICAATALANEISFWSAICANEWVAAHARARQRTTESDS